MLKTWIFLLSCSTCFFLQNKNQSNLTNEKSWSPSKIYESIRIKMCYNKFFSSNIKRLFCVKFLLTYFSTMTLNILLVSLMLMISVQLAQVVEKVVQWGYLNSMAAISQSGPDETSFEITMASYTDGIRWLGICHWCNIRMALRNSPQGH